MSDKTRHDIEAIPHTHPGEKLADPRERLMRIAREREQARLYYSTRYGLLSYIHPLQSNGSNLQHPLTEVLFDDLSSRERKEYFDVYGSFDYSYPADKLPEYAPLDAEKERFLMRRLELEDDPASYLRDLMTRMSLIQKGKNSSYPFEEILKRGKADELEKGRRYCLMRCVRILSPDGVISLEAHALSREDLRYLKAPR